MKWPKSDEFWCGGWGEVKMGSTISNLGSKMKFLWFFRKNASGNPVSQERRGVACLLGIFNLLSDIELGYVPLTPGATRLFTPSNPL